MGNETAILKLLSGLVGELRDVAKDLARAGNALSGDSRDQVREVQYRVEAMRRYYEYLQTVIDQPDDESGPLLRPAAGGEPR